MTAEERDLFENWIAHMDDALEEFSARLPPAVRGALDSTPSSLDALEAFLLDLYPDVETIRTDPDSHLDGAARYVGEVFRRHIGGTWRMRDDDPSYVYAGLPELTFLPARDTPACPITLVAAAMNRRTGTFLSSVLTNQAEIIARARG